MKKITDEAKFYLDLVKKKPVAFGLECGFTDLKDIHNNWIKLFLFNTEDMTLQAHRGSYKTTCLSIAIAIMIIINPELSIIFMRKADNDVKEIITQVASLLKKDLFQALSLALWEKPCILKTESVFEVETNLKLGIRGTPQLFGMGAKSGITGKHGDIIITDDIVNVNDRISKAHREKTKLTYQELQNIKNRGGRFINTGTPWHRDDAFTLMPNLIKFDCYSTGLMTDQQIFKIRDSMSISLFSANYELKHISDADSFFKNPKYGIYPTVDSRAQIDCAYGGRDTIALTIMAERSGAYFAYGKVFTGHVQEHYKEIASLLSKYKVGTLFAETNADKGFFAKEFRNYWSVIKSYHESMNKHLKIVTYLQKEWKNITWDNETDPNYMEQIVDYQEGGEPDDAPDSVASLIREFNRGKVKAVNAVSY